MENFLEQIVIAVTDLWTLNTYSTSSAVTDHADSRTTPTRPSSNFGDIVDNVVQNEQELYRNISWLTAFNETIGNIFGRNRPEN